MRNYRYLLYYIITIGGFTLLMYIIVARGENLSTFRSHDTHMTSVVDGLDHFGSSVKESLSSALPRLLLQIVTIIGIARLFSYLARKIGQPGVVGEIIAGIFLGPSVLGALTPQVSGFLFPAESINILLFFSQIGLILFMFIIGMDIDLKVLSKRAPVAFVVSHASIVIPFALGMTLALYIYSVFAPAGVSFLSFALFIGISMSITAFPVLARILQERNLLKTPVGTLAITCAAIDDISAWCLLAALIAIVKAGSFLSSLYTILVSVLYVIFMLGLVRPFLHRLGEVFTRKDGIGKPVVAVFLITLLISSYITEIIGIHAIFGAFVAGAIMPPNLNFRKILIEKLEDLALILLLPIFFVISGLRTEIGLINTPELWKITGWVILIAVAGKFAGSALSLRFIGQKWRDSLIIGALMNTRGLMQLVVLSIGYDLGVLSPEIYTIMIIMAIVTTLMTGPALNIIDRFLPEKNETKGPAEKTGVFRILISFGNPVNGIRMMKLANEFVKGKTSEGSVTLLHISQGYDLHKYQVEGYEQEIFSPVISEAEKLGLKPEIIFRATEDLEREIIETANSGRFDMIIAGKALSPYEGSLLGSLIRIIGRMINPERVIDSIKGQEKLFSRNAFDGPTRRLVKSIKITTAIFTGKELNNISDVILPVYSTDDKLLFPLAARLVSGSGANIRLLDYYGITVFNPEMEAAFKQLSSQCPGKISRYDQDEIPEILKKEYDLILVSIDSWQKFIYEKRLQSLPSALIIKS